MPSFVDASGREWTVTITVEEIAAVKEALDIHLTKLVDEDIKKLFELIADPIECVNVLWVCCRSQAEARGIDQRQFAKGFAGESFEAGGRCLVRAVFGFFPPSRRDPLLRLVEKTEQALTIAMAQAAKKIDGITEQTMNEMIETGSTNFASS
jgi:hypothetical protein